MKRRDFLATYPLCHAVCYCPEAIFMYTAHKVIGDKDFIMQLLKTKDFAALEFMEVFYAGLRKERTGERDISNRSNGISYDEYIREKK